MKVMIEIPEVDLQTQPDAHTCSQTCLAMALDVPVLEVIRVFGRAPFGTTDLITALTLCRFHYAPLTASTLLFLGWYFLVVPSLNIAGGKSSNSSSISWPWSF